MRSRNSVLRMFISAFSWIRWDSISGSYLIWIVCDCEVLSVSYCYSVIVILSQLLLFILQLARRGFVGRCNGLARWALKLSHWRGAIGSADWRVAHPWCNTWVSCQMSISISFQSKFVLNGNAMVDNDSWLDLTKKK